MNDTTRIDNGTESTYIIDLFQKMLPEQVAEFLSHNKPTQDNRRAVGLALCSYAGDREGFALWAEWATGSPAGNADIDALSLFKEWGQIAETVMAAMGAGRQPPDGEVLKDGPTPSDYGLPHVALERLHAALEAQYGHAMDHGADMPDVTKRTKEATHDALVKAFNLGYHTALDVMSSAKVVEAQAMDERVWYTHLVAVAAMMKVHNLTTQVMSTDVIENVLRGHKVNVTYPTTETIQYDLVDALPEDPQ